MPVTQSTPDVAGLRDALPTLQGWQREGAPIQLHPGDLGWQWRAGAEATAAAVRTWSRDGQLLAVGLVDGPELLRLAIAPGAEHDPELAARLVADLTTGPFTAMEARSRGLLEEQLLAAGWVHDEPWTPLHLELTTAVPGCGVRIEVAGPELAEERAAVHRASFDRSTFDAARWHVMAAGPLYADARCLVALDAHGTAVAATTVWSAGPGRPGLIEPLGAHRDHRGHGYGRAITIAAAAALQQLGASSATVCTPAANAVGVAAYASAGFTRLPDVRDLHRPACAGLSPA